MAGSSDQDQQACNTGLSLDLLGFTNSSSSKENSKPLTAALKFDHVLPSLSLGLADQGFSASPGSSSYSNNGNSASVKRSVDQEKEFGGSHGEEVEVEKGGDSWRVSDEEEEASPRKKLRLTKEQSAVLEDSFKEHSTLNPNQKQALAKRLNLRPRQVEVWFQNRRARTKLKQTEMDCELLKKCCETLTEENKRLQKELQELRALKLAAPVYMQGPGAATLSMCPSCERFVAATSSPAVDKHHHLSASKGDGGGGSGVAVFPTNMNGTKPQQFFTHPSALC